jgi:hypothetical protein
MKNMIRSTVAFTMLLGLLSLPFVAMRIGYTIELIGALEEIDQLRTDMATVSSNSSDYILGQATSWNQRIRAMQAFNRTWWGDLFIHDGWSTVQPLPLSIASRSSTLAEREVGAISVNGAWDGK